MPVVLAIVAALGVLVVAWKVLRSVLGAAFGAVLALLRPVLLAFELVRQGLAAQIRLDGCALRGKIGHLPGITRTQGQGQRVQRLQALAAQLGQRQAMAAHMQPPGVWGMDG